MQRKTMTMNDWIEVLNGFITMSRQNILADAGKISAELAQKKALTEFQTYKEKTFEELSSVEKHFLENIEKTAKKLTAEKKKRMKKR